MPRERLLLSLLSIGLIAAGPVDSDDWTTLAAGGTRAGRGVVVISASQQDARGFTLHAAASSVIGAPSSGSAAIRLGLHRDYGGVELGAGGFFEAFIDSRASVNAWGGLPVCHAWIDTWPAEESGAVGAALSGAGLGHHSTWVSASAGVWATESGEVPVSLRLAAQAREGLWLGGTAWLEPDETRAMLTVSISRAGYAAHDDPSTAPPL